MPFDRFRFPQVLRDLGLGCQAANSFGPVPPLELPGEVVSTLVDEANLAASINTERARTEFAVAPLLLELRRRHRSRFGVFPGVDLDVDPARELTGTCDCLLTRSPNQDVLTTPILAVVGAKNESIRGGLGQCIASMVAIQVFDQNDPTAPEAIHGAVTTARAATGRS